MSTTDSVFQRALSNMLTEIFDGPPGQEAYVLNPGDPGLLRQLDTIEASAASKRPMPGKTTIAAHIDHIYFGLGILNRWAAGEANPWAGADWNGSWQRTVVTDDQWRTLCRGLRHEAEKWRKGREHAHELGRHGCCRRSLHGRPHGLSLRGYQANPGCADDLAWRTIFTGEVASISRDAVAFVGPADELVLGGGCFHNWAVRDMRVGMLGSGLMGRRFWSASFGVGPECLYLVS